MRFGGIFKYDEKKHRLSQIETDLGSPDHWADRDRYQALQKEQALIARALSPLTALGGRLQEAGELVALAAESSEEEQPAIVAEVTQELAEVTRQIEELEFRRKFSGELDVNEAYLDIKAGSGGTEAQDWSEMLLRMYLKWAESHRFKAEIVELSAGEVAGIKSATIKMSAEYAYGWLRTETGIHRLVRKSPFNANNKRQTSFSSVFVYPIVEDDIAIDINPSDLRIDTYRAGGAGGQHVNRTDSAVRITHLPTNTVVQCQSERSQHQNKASALKQLKAKLYQIQLGKRQTEQQALEDSKSEIGWGHQIRSYILDEARVKDLRTGVETRNTKAVLDGDLDRFIEASLLI